MISFHQVSPPKPCLQLSFPTHMPYTPPHLILDLITRTTFGEEYRSLSSCVCSFLHSPVTFSKKSPQHPILKYLQPRSSLSVSDQVSHPYKTTGKIIVLYILNIGFCGLGVACWTLVPKFAGSNQAEAVGFLGRKNPQHTFLRRGSKAVGPMS